MSAPVAKLIEVDYTAHMIRVDGVSVPWAVAGGGPTISFSPDGFAVVTVPVLAERVIVRPS